MATRTHAREMVVGLLYAYSLGNDSIFHFADMLMNERKIRNAQASFARDLFNGVLNHLEEIDSIIELHLKSWELSRLGVIDKCILRLGVYEIIKCKIDAPVAINEAVEIAKTFGEENTPKFVNGVLDAISKKDVNHLMEALKAKKDSKNDSARIAKDSKKITKDSKRMKKDSAKNSKRVSKNDSARIAKDSMKITKDSKRMKKDSTKTFTKDSAKNSKRITSDSTRIANNSTKAQKRKKPRIFGKKA